MFRKLFKRNQNQPTEPNQQIPSSNSISRYSPGADGDERLKLTVIEILTKYGVDPTNRKLYNSGLDELFELQSKISSDFTTKERKWRKAAFSKAELRELHDVVNATSVGGKRDPNSTIGPTDYWGPLSHPNVDRNTKRKLFKRGRDILSSAIERHFLLMAALEPGNDVLDESERDAVLQDFIENRPNAAKLMDALGSSRPPSMGEELIADPLNTDWPTYEKYFFEMKYDFSKLDEWRKARKVWFQHTNLDYQITTTYRQREELGMQATIPLCLAQIDFAKEALVALPRNHEFEHEYRAELQTRYLAQRGSDTSDGWMPTYTKFTMPNHRGFKQLAIIYDKLKNPEAAIEICQQAISVGWPGDWKERSARYEKKLSQKRK